MSCSQPYNTDSQTKSTVQEGTDSDNESCGEHTLRWRYSQLLEHSTLHLFPEFVNNFKGQSKHQQELGRVAVLESFNGQPAQTRTFKTSSDLESYFRSEPTVKHDRQRRRLFKLEDLPRNYVEILGCNLLVPPSFFASQWSIPRGGDYRRNCFTMNPKTGILLTYAQFYTLENDFPSSNVGGLLSLEDHNVKRSIHFEGNDMIWENPGVTRCYHKLSYWASSASASSWDALILTDPPATRARVPSDMLPFDVTNVFHFQPETSLCPSISSSAAISGDSWQWVIHERGPTYISMFDDVLGLQEPEGPIFCEQPWKSTALCRKLAVASCIGFLRKNHQNLVRAFVQADIYNPTSDPNSWPPSKYWNLPDLNFRTPPESLLGAKFSINLVQGEISRNIVGLGMDPMAMHIPLSPEDDWERLAWKETLDLCSFMLKIVETLTQTYSHQATIRKTQQSNHIANSVGKITSLASLFIPISIVAGIFSMGADYLPGGNLFWVFWAVTGPLCLVTGTYTFKAYYFPAVVEGHANICSRLTRRIWFNSQERLP